MARSRGQQLVIKQMPLRREMSLGSGRGSATSCGTPISLSFSFLAGKGSRDARPPKGSWFRANCMSHASSVENKTHGISPFVPPPALSREAALSAGGGLGNPEPLLGGALT